MRTMSPPREKFMYMNGCHRCDRRVRATGAHCQGLGLHEPGRLLVPLLLRCCWVFERRDERAERFVETRGVVPEWRMAGLAHAPPSLRNIVSKPLAYLTRNNAMPPVDEQGG